VNVSRGMETLREASRKRCDGKIQYMEGKDSIIVHKSCRSRYTNYWYVQREAAPEDSHVRFIILTYLEMESLAYI